MNNNLLKRCVAEFIGTFALIFIGVGAIHNSGDSLGGGGLVGLALAHGFPLAVMVSATGAISGGHLNPAVTFGLFVGGKINLKDSIAYWVAQLAGGSAAGFLLLTVFGDNGVKIVADGTPKLADGISPQTGIIVEAVLTF